MDKSNNSLFLSVIIPAHNSSNTLSRCVDSILAQTYINYEVILVENNSSDDTLLWCEKYSDLDSRIKYISTKEKGVSNARNIGLEYAIGDIITFCDADDYYQKDAFQVVVDSFSGNDVLVFGFNVLRDGVIIRKNIPDKDVIWDKEEYLNHTIIDNTIMGSVWNRFYKREIIEGKKFNIELSLMEDTHFNCIVASSCETFSCNYINYIGYNYIVSKGSASHNFDNAFNGIYNKYVQSIETIEKDCTLSKANRKLLKAKKAKMCSNDAWLLRKDKSRKKIKSASKTVFWKNYFSYIMCRHFSLEDKIKSTIKNIL